MDKKKFNEIISNGEGFDICSKCGEVFEYGTLDDITEDSFDLICNNCKLK